MTKLFICITGMPGSGKSLVSRLISEIINAKVISMGDVVRKELKSLGLPQDLKTTIKFAEELRKKYGKDIIAKLTLKYVGKDEVVIIDGVRSLDELEIFRSKGSVIVVAVHASPKVRYSRLKNRCRPDDPKSWNEFKARDLKELSFGIGNVIALADLVIVNEDIDVNSLKVEIKRKLMRLLGNVLSKSRSRS